MEQSDFHKEFTKFEDFSELLSQVGENTLKEAQEQIEIHPNTVDLNLDSFSNIQLFQEEGRFVAESPSTTTDETLALTDFSPNEVLADIVNDSASIHVFSNELKQAQVILNDPLSLSEDSTQKTDNIPEETKVTSLDFYAPELFSSNSLPGYEAGNSSIVIQNYESTELFDVYGLIYALQNYDISMYNDKQLVESVVTDVEYGFPLTAEFYSLSHNPASLSDIDFSEAPTLINAIDVIDYHLGRSAMWEGGPTDNFAARFSGALNIETAGEYTFYLTSDDGSKLTINDFVLGNDGLHSDRLQSFSIHLDEGLHDLEALYFERSGLSTMEIEWQGPDTLDTRVNLSSDHFIAQPIEKIPEPAPSSELTLKGEFYELSYAPSTLNDIDFSANPTYVNAVEAIDYHLRGGAMWENGVTDNFAARFTGKLNIDTAGDYTFYMTSDDGSKLTIGSYVLGNDGLHSDRTESFTVHLSEGEHAFEALYFERSGNATMEIEWQGPDTVENRTLLTSEDFAPYSESPVDIGSQNFPSEQGVSLLAEYFDLSFQPRLLSDIPFNDTPTHTESVGAIDFRLNAGAMWEGGVTDDFAAKFTGKLNIESAGDYTFYMTSDDGSQLTIGNEVLGNDGLHSDRTESFTISLETGEYDFEALYFERGGSSTMDIEWSGPDTQDTRITLTEEAFVTLHQEDNYFYGSIDDDTFVGTNASDHVFGNAGNDIFIFGAGGGQDTFDGGIGGWTDSIQLEMEVSEINQIDSQNWLITTEHHGNALLNSDSNLDLNDLTFDTSATGHISLSDGSSIEFSNVDKLSWL